MREVAEDVGELALDLQVALAGEEVDQLGHHHALPDDLRGRDAVAAEVGDEPAGVPPDLVVGAEQKVEDVVEQFVAVESVGVLVLLSHDVANDPDGVLLDLLLLRVQGADDALQDDLVTHEGLDGLVLFVVRQFVESLEDDFVLALHVLQQWFEGDFLIIDVVDEDPQLARVGLHDLEYVCLSADDLVAGSDDGHLADVHGIDSEVGGEVLLELLHHCQVVIELLLLDRGQHPQRLVDHVAVHLQRLGIFGAVDRLVAAPVVGDGVGGERRQGGGDGRIQRMQDGLALLRGVELEVVEVLHGLAVAVEGLGAREEAEVLGVGTQLVLQHLTHHNIYKGCTIVAS